MESLKQKAQVQEDGTQFGTVEKCVASRTRAMQEHGCARAREHIGIKNVGRSIGRSGTLLWRQGGSEKKKKVSSKADTASWASCEELRNLWIAA